ncbi:MAG: DUF4262 domain-containing protein [Myxococcales bacterium]|nr:DUF4262 domain-containing protein [Myxococcales bacterium]
MSDIEDKVRQFGWARLGVDDADPPFTYTIGLMSTHDHAELIVLGTRSEFGGAVLATLHERIAQGERFEEPGIHDGILKRGYRIEIRTVHPTQHMFYLGYAIGHVRERGLPELRAVQVVLPDRQGVLPGEPGCDPNWAARTPHLGVPVPQSEIDEFLEDYGDN